MSYTPQNKPPQSFGQMQDTFTFRFRSFQNGEQFTIVEDAPRHRLPRTGIRKGGKGDYTVCLVQINFNNAIADLELYDYELSNLAALCPKGTQNFKGATFAFDGRRWQYICSSDMPEPRDPRQPDLYPRPQATIQQPQDQADVFMQKLVNSIKTLDALGNKVDASVMTKIAESITPGKALDLIMTAKAKGYIIESQGIFKVIE